MRATLVCVRIWGLSSRHESDRDNRDPGHRHPPRGSRDDASPIRRVHHEERSRRTDRSWDYVRDPDRHHRGDRR